MIKPGAPGKPLIPASPGIPAGPTGPGLPGNPGIPGTPIKTFQPKDLSSMELKINRYIQCKHKLNKIIKCSYT